MSFRRVLPLLITSAAIFAAASPSIAGGLFKSPAWLSIESPVNPYDPATRGAVLLVHTQLVNGNAQMRELTGSAEGLVNGARRSIALHFDSLARLNTFGVRKQWPSEGAWLLRISLRETTAIVSLDAGGNVTAARVPTENTRDIPLPRAVTSREIDSLLAAGAKR
jgi:hypothetical protein